MGGRGSNSPWSEPSGIEAVQKISERGHVGEQYSPGASINDIMASNGVDRATAERMYQAALNWSEADYRTIREYQQTGKGSKEVKDEARVLEQFISTAPKWNGGETFRGLSDVPIDTAKALIKKGTVFDMNGTSSWTTSMESASSFALGASSTTASIIFRSKTQSKGTSIQHMSSYFDEGEVVVSKKSKYKVVSSKKTGTNSYVVTVEEV